MKEQLAHMKLSYEDIVNNINSILKIGKNTKVLHASEERTKYCAILEWFDLSLSSLVKNKRASALQMCEGQKQIVISCLCEMIEMTKKECVEKSLILSMILEYIINMLNNYWQTYQNANRELRYDYQHNTVKFQQEHLSKIQQITQENEQLKKDKEHRWRNAYMLIKDNRIHRRQNKKLIKSIGQQIQKNTNLAEQLIIIRQQNEKLKIKLAVLQKNDVELQEFITTSICLQELKKKLKLYPRKIKKILKDELTKIEIYQINNLNDKIEFIIKAMEETGEIIDEYYDEYYGNINFHYNISTQTDNPTEEKAVNTTTIRHYNFESNVRPADLIQLTLQEVFSLRIKAIKVQKQSESKSMNSTMNLSKKMSLMKRQQVKYKFNQKKNLINDHLSICESVKLTIKNNKFSYISTHNNEINDYYNQKETSCHDKVKNCQILRKKSFNQIQIQTSFEDIDHLRETTNRMPSHLHSDNNQLLKNSKPQPMKSYFKYIQLKLNREVSYQYRPQLKKIIKLKRQTFAIYNKKVDRQILKPILQELSVLSSQDKPQNHQLQQLHQLQQVKKALMERKMVKPTLKKISSKTDIILTKNLTDEVRGRERVEDIVIKQSSFQQQEDNFMVTVTTAINRSSLYRPEVFSSKQSKYPNISINQTEKASNQDKTRDHDGVRNGEKKKEFNSTLNELNLNKNNNEKHQRYNSSLTLQTDSIYANNKTSKQSASKKFRNSKRTATETSETFQKYTQNMKSGKPYKIKKVSNFSNQLSFKQPNSIKEDVQKEVSMQEQSKGKKDCSILKDHEFMKIIEKILNNMNFRHKELVSHQYQLKDYLQSYFKLQYSKTVYPSFINHIIAHSHQEIHCLFIKLLNHHLPYNYLQHLFKTFILVINKTNQLGNHPLSNHIHPQILQYLLSFYLSYPQIHAFIKNRKQLNCNSLFGWFICVEDNLKTNCLQSQLYSFLSELLCPLQQTISYEFIEQMTYFLVHKRFDNKKLFEFKVVSRNNIQLYRLCFFCYKYGWQSLLNIKNSISRDYQQKIGEFNEQKSLQKIQQNKSVLQSFKHLNSIYQGYLIKQCKYLIRIPASFLMLIELNILEYRLKTHFPLCLDLKCLTLTLQALEKRQIIEKIRRQQGIEGELWRHAID